MAVDKMPSSRFNGNGTIFNGFVLLLGTVNCSVVSMMKPSSTSCTMIAERPHSWQGVQKLWRNWFTVERRHRLTAREDPNKYRQTIERNSEDGWRKTTRAHQMTDLFERSVLHRMRLILAVDLACARIEALHADKTSVKVRVVACNDWLACDHVEQGHDGNVLIGRCLAVVTRNKVDLAFGATPACFLIESMFASTACLCRTVYGLKDQMFAAPEGKIWGAGSDMYCGNNLRNSSPSFSTCAGLLLLCNMVAAAVTICVG